MAGRCRPTPSTDAPAPTPTVTTAAGAKNTLLGSPGGEGGGDRREYDREQAYCGGLRNFRHCEWFSSLCIRTLRPMSPIAGRDLCSCMQQACRGAIRHGAKAPHNPKPSSVVEIQRRVRRLVRPGISVGNGRHGICPSRCPRH